MGNHPPLATPPPEPNPKAREGKAEVHGPSVSSFQKTVELRDWWLVKSNKDLGDKRLAVAGVNSTGKQALRVFNSAPITKRYDVFTLETADGITVLLSGFINKPRTIENGFPPEIFRHFLFGFPPFWQECAKKFMAQESGSRTDLVDQSTNEENVDSLNHDNVNDHTSNISVKETSTNILDHNIGGFVGVSVSQDKDCPSIQVSSTDKGLENGKSRDVLVGASSLVQDPGRMMRFIDAGGVIHDFLSPAIENSQSLERTVNFPEHPMSLPAVKSRVEENIFSSSTVEQNIVSAVKSGSRKRDPSGNLKDDHMQEPHPIYQTVEDSEVLEQCENHPEYTMMSTELQTGVEAVLVTPSKLERNTWNATASRSEYRKRSYQWKNLKHNKKQAAVFGSHEEKTLTSDAGEHRDGKEWQRDLNGTLRSSAKVGSVEAMMRAGEKLKSPSEKWKSQENMPSAARKGGSSRKKARRKINFNLHETPCTHERKETTCILSPESLNLKRSRSGRLLLPTLDFWRGQVPVYDAERNITGIQEELDAAKPSRGSKSEPIMRRKRR